MFSQQKRTITGQVAGDDGMPIPGAAVLIQGTTTGVITDENGKYSIQAGNFDVLVFSSLGFKDDVQSVNDRKQINVVLVSDTKVLDDAVVIGYGTQKKSDLTGSVGIVSMEEILSPATGTTDQALQGRGYPLRRRRTRPGHLHPYSRHPEHFGRK